jgi:3-oxoacyl-[acyl-carrier protein] reductase
MFDFVGKILVLTGANGGIGRSIAKTFYDLGAGMLLTDLNSDELKTFACDLDPSGKRVFVTSTDVTNSQECNALAKMCNDRFGGADYFVSSAGLYLDQLVESMTDEQWRQSIGINLDGVFLTCRAMIPLMRAGGAIVNLSSMAAHRGSYQHSHYAAAKGAVLSFSRSLALELAPTVRVNTVSPGLIETEMIKHRMATEGAKIVEPTALKRLGQPVEVATVIAFLCSDGASFITGETIHVNGGLYIAG